MTPERISQAHLIDDIETKRTSAVRTIKSAEKLLADGLHALRNGSESVTEEYLERVIESLRAEVANQTF